MTTSSDGRPSALGPHRPGGILRRFAALGLGEITARLVAFATMLVVARRLGPGPFGSIGAAAGVLLYLSQLADGGIELVGIPAVAQNRQEAGQLASAVLTIRAASAIGLTVLVLIATWFLPSPDGLILAIYAATLIWTALSTRWVYLGMERPAAVVFARVTGELTGLAIVLFAVRSDADILRVPLAAAMTAAITAVLMLAGLGRLGIRVRPLLAWQRCAALFGRARHMVLFTLLGLVLFNFDLLYLRVMKGPEEAGLYAAAYTAISLGANVIVAYAHSVLPTLSRTGGERGGRDASYRQAMLRGFVATVPVALGGWLVADQVVELVFGSAFEGSVGAMQWLLLTLPLAAIREIAVVALIGSHGERTLVRVNATTAIANVILNLVLVPAYGVLGAAAATVVTEGVRLGLATNAAHRAGFSWPPLLPYARPLACGLGMWAVVRFSGASHPFTMVGIGALSYGLLLALTGTVRWRPGELPHFADS